MLLYEPDKVENDPLRYEDVQTPEPKRGELLLKIISCGVCHSNLHMIEGDWVQYGLPGKKPIIPGHEIIGRVEEVGEGVTDFKKGDLAGVQPIYSTCGHCEYCLTGREQLCQTRQVTGETVDGGYAEYIVTKADFTYHVPDNIDPQTSSPLFCPGITAYGAVKKADLSPEKTAYVIGVGGVGHMVIQLAKLYGPRIVAVSTLEAHRKLAQKLGADEVLDPGRNYEKVKGMKREADSVIVFAPSQEAVDAAFRLVKPGGTVVMGVHGQIHNYYFFDEVKVTGTLVGNRQDMKEVLRLASEGKIRVEAEKFPLKEANEALKRLKHGEINGRAVLIP
ncbi:alcohol dehydrogenase catalytic domain-containing protein [Tardisphaera miroshnichenkoae]